jgi:hypothetical protein
MGTTAILGGRAPEGMAESDPRQAANRKSVKARPGARRERTVRRDRVLMRAI